MACGIPSVVTRVGGNPEAISDGQNGFLVPTEDDQTAAGRILFLLRNPERAAQIGVAAQAAVHSQFSAETMIKKLIGVYDDLLAQREERR
jgi:glycosyltransferase involved in cell wall biosynthesis